MFSYDVQALEIDEVDNLSPVDVNPVSTFETPTLGSISSFVKREKTPEEYNKFRKTHSTNVLRKINRKKSSCNQYYSKILLSSTTVT